MKNSSATVSRQPSVFCAKSVEKFTKLCYNDLDKSEFAEMMQVKKLIILRGNSGSGKTTIAKELQQLLGRNTMVISQDVVRREMLYVRDGENTLALPLLTELLKYGNMNCDIVILEGILNSSWYRPLFEYAVKIYESNVFAYYFDIPFEETVKRHNSRPQRNEFSEDDMRKWWKEKDCSAVLNEIIITKDKDKDSIVKEIYSRVNN